MQLYGRDLTSHALWNGRKSCSRDPNLLRSKAIISVLSFLAVSVTKRWMVTWPSASMMEWLFMSNVWIQYYIIDWVIIYWLIDWLFTNKTNKQTTSVFFLFVHKKQTHQPLRTTVRQDRVRGGVCMHGHRAFCSPAKKNAIANGRGQRLQAQPTKQKKCSVWASKPRPPAWEGHDPTPSLAGCYGDDHFFYIYIPHWQYPWCVGKKY